MKLLIALYTLAFSTCTLTASAIMNLESLSNRWDAFSSALRLLPDAKVLVKPSIHLSANAPDKHGYEIQQTQLGRRHPFPALNSISPPRNRDHREPKLSRRWRNKPLFAEPSITIEETGASIEERLPPATIVEWETKASSDTYGWTSYLTRSGMLHYCRVQEYADTVVVGLVLSFVAVLLVIELWNPILQKVKSTPSKRCGQPSE
jgi:hypothetical protein